MLEQRINEWRSSGTAQNDQDAHQQDSYNDWDQVPLLVMSDELY